MYKHGNRFKVLIFFVSVALTACEANQMYVGLDTVLGVNARVSTDRQSGDLIIGYDRDFATIVPKSVPVSDNGHHSDAESTSEESRDAMSALVCSEVRVSGIFLSGFTEAMATGEAAKKFAKQATAEEVGDFFSCLRPVTATNQGDTEGGASQ